jgi:dTDP-4-amino-4,6-dideoxygalactose transaminase
MKERNNNTIYVTKPFLPPLEEFIPYLEKIWEKKWLTNNGDFHREFENELTKFLGVKYISLFCNGTLALITALQALRIKGEVITTPYSFVATTHALWWNNIKPVFVDIEPEYCNIDSSKIESAITPNTTAILPVHVYGNPCETKKINEIAIRHNLKVIYDACHAFGVKKNGISILNHGDLSVLSFHATKVFNTFEGGAIVCHDLKMKKRIDFLKNFGFADEVTVVAPGINAKMNEFQSALGITQLKYFDANKIRRKKLYDHYISKLKGIKGLRFMKPDKQTEYNYSYFPIFVDGNKFGKSRDDVYDLLKKNNIYSRRYFYPLISEFPVYRNLDSSSKDNLLNAYEISKRVLCLPMYSELNENEINKILKIILK